MSSFSTSVGPASAPAAGSSPARFAVLDHDLNAEWHGLLAGASALAVDTHRFEARYLDGLVGPWPAAAATYAARSPLQHADRIRCPVIFFQGLEDVVVPTEQTDRMAEPLERNGVAVEVHRFANEGHGFRNGATQVQVLEATEAFFRRHFQL